MGQQELFAGPELDPAPTLQAAANPSRKMPVFRWTMMLGDPFRDSPPPAHSGGRMAAAG